MGPIQTSLNRLIGMTAAGVAAGKKYVQSQEQTIQEAVDKRTQEAIARATETEKEDQEALAKKQALKQQKQEASAVATEADLINLGASEEEALAYRLAQERGLANPKRMIFDKEGKPIATYEEMATLLADQSLSGTLTSKLRGKGAIKFRKQLLEGRTHKQRVEEAVLSIGGGK